MATELSRTLSATASTTRDRWLSRLGVLMSVATFAVAIGILVIGTRGDPRFQLGLNLIGVAFLGTITLFPLVGALIIQRRPSTRVPWLMVLLGLGLGLALLTAGYGVVGRPPAAWPFWLELLALSQLLFIPALAVAPTLILLLFPTDRLLGPRWRIAVAICLSGLGLYELGTLVRPDVVGELLPGVGNPLAAPPDLAPLFAVIVAAGGVLILVAFLLATISLVIRYRRAAPIEAAQIRWIAFVALVEVPVLALNGVTQGALAQFFSELGPLLLATLPIAIGIAITRYRLYDIDRLINRALVYGSLTAILAGTFTAAVSLAQRVFVAITNETSDAAIVGATLVIATLYAPLRKRLEGFVDRRFKFEEARFGAYRDELKKHLALTEPGRATQRLVDEAVRELDAVGGAVLDAAGTVIATAGAWPAEPIIRLPLDLGGRKLATLAIGPRPGGGDHDPRHVAALGDLASLAATAIRQATSGRVRA